jgi:hypothetical protein
MALRRLSSPKPDGTVDPAPPGMWTVDGVPLVDLAGRPRPRPVAVP